jgi:hypothetical protein
MTTLYVGMICCTDEGADGNGIMIPLVLWLAAVIISAFVSVAPFAPAAALPGLRESFRGASHYSHLDTWTLDSTIVFNAVAKTTPSCVGLVRQGPFLCRPSFPSSFLPCSALLFAASDYRSFHAGPSAWADPEEEEEEELWDHVGPA